MIEDPLVHNDEYSHAQDRQANQRIQASPSKRSLSVSNRSLNLGKAESPQRHDESPKNVVQFRFMDTKHERIAKRL